MKLFKKYIIIILILLLTVMVSTSCLSLSDMSSGPSNSFAVTFIESLILQAMNYRESELLKSTENSHSGP